MPSRLETESQSFHCPRRLICLHVFFCLVGWNVWSQFSSDYFAFSFYFLLGLSASVSVWVLLNPGDGVLRFVTATFICVMLFIFIAFVFGIYLQFCDAGAGIGLEFVVMSIPGGAILALPFCICVVLPMILLGWVPCKSSSLTLLAPEDQLESQPIVTTRTYLMAFVLVAFVMAIIAKTMQSRGVTAAALVKNTENNLLFARNVLILAGTFYLTWAFAYIQWALGSRKFSGLLRVFSAFGLIAAHSAGWMMIACLLPFNDPIFQCDSRDLKLKEAFISSAAGGIVLSLSPILVFWTLRKAGFRLCYRGKPIGDLA